MARNKKGEKINGWVNLDKPAGLTSTQALGKLRRILNAQKLGHAGTLDPLATGVLPIALGEATKTIPFIQDAVKTYSFTIRWGEHRDTLDAEGQILETSNNRPDKNAIEKAIEKYIGEIEQMPPQFSALKVDGQRAYDLARAGETVALKSRKVFIKSLELIPPTLTLPPPGGGMRSVGEGETEPYTKLGGGAMDETSFLMTCGKGTYVRALARDLATDLGTLGYISKLTRERVGNFTRDNTISLDLLENMDHSAALEAAVLPITSALDDILALEIRQDEAAQLRNGQTLAFIARPDFERLKQAGLGDKDQSVEAVTICKGKAVALVCAEGPNVRPVKVFNL